MLSSPLVPIARRIVLALATTASLVLPRLGLANEIDTTAMTLLRKNCVSCHNEEKRKGGLAITTREAALEGGDGGPGFVPGSPDESAIIMSLEEGADPHMPPKKQLSADKIAALKEWVRQGAQWNVEVLAGDEGPRTVQLAALPASYHPILALSLSPDSKRLAVGCGSELVIYDASEANLAPKARASAHPDAVQSVAWSADGKRIATGAFRRVVIWNAETLEVQHEVTTGLTDRIAALRFSPDGSRLIVADGRIATEGTVHLLDANSGAIAETWKAHGDTIFDLSVSSDGRYLATAGGDKLVKIWDLQTRAEVAKLEGHISQVLTVGFDASGGRLLTGGADQQLKVWDVKTKDRIMTLGRHSEAINTAAWIQSGKAVLAVTERGGMLRYTDMKVHEGTQSSSSGTERKLERADGDLYCMTSTQEGDRIYAGSHDGRIFAWNKDGKLVQRLQVNEKNTTALLAK